MANTTDPLARSIHGTDPQKLVERIAQSKICSTPFWKEKCFGVSAETLVDLAMELRACGGFYGSTSKVTDFLCLTLKMLQIQPQSDIVVEFIKDEEHKYLRLLGAFYLRLVGNPVDVYHYLEPLLNDYRKIRYATTQGNFVARHVDEVVWDLLRQDVFCSVALPRLPRRHILEGSGQLRPR